METTNDNVLKPQHYMIDIDGVEIETKDIIKAQLGSGYQNWLEGNVLKYILRWRRKNGIEDLRKAQENLRMLIIETGGADFENATPSEKSNVIDTILKFVVLVLP